jgi:SIR2-like domain
LLLGAGCPAAVQVDGAPLVPDVGGLTLHVADALAKGELAEQYATALKQVPAEANIEMILSHIRTLAEVAGDEEPVRGLSKDDLSRLDGEICTVIRDAVAKDLPPDSAYQRVAAWVGASIRLHPVEIFTPNYDTLVEQALEMVRVPYFDGFVGSCQPFFDTRAMEEDELPARWARVWKIHGSINWSANASDLIVRTPPEDSAGSQVIYPSHLKYDESRRMPYLAMIDRLRAFLRQPAAVLITCGFSFRDEHLNEVLMQGAQGNASAMIFGLLHGDMASYDGGARLAKTRPNLSLLAKDAAVVGTRAEPWLKADAVPAGTDARAVSWTEDGDDRFKAAFLLGDFGAFARLCSEVIGEYEDESKSAD